MFVNFIGLFTVISLVVQYGWCSVVYDHSRCSSAAECIQRLRRTMSETGRFWFGDEWRFNCAHNAANRFRTNTVQCLNSRDLQNFHSLGSRLFRVNTFTQAFLENLRILPRIVFNLRDGGYRACDHEFSVWTNRKEWEVGFEHPPIIPFQTKQLPIVDWSGLSFNDSYVVLILDAGFGALKYLASDFPRATRVIYEYEQLDNFRLHQPSPFVVLIFEAPPTGNIFIEKSNNNDKFDLTQFMIDNELDDGLVGLNWFLVEADAFSIERQRVKGTVDNCHALVQQKLIEDRRWKFVEFFQLNEMDSSLTISAIRPRSEYFACCETLSISEDTVFADPLGDGQLQSMTLRIPPLVTSFRSIGFGDNYQRSQRHYIVLKGEKYTLVMFDPTRKYLYWMVADIPSEALSLGDLGDASLIVPYIPPIPKEPNECLFAVFILFKQPIGVDMTEFYNNDHVFRSRFCTGHCAHRNSFEVEQFKSFHQLQLSAISWLKVCYDIFEASRQIQTIVFTNSTLENAKNFRAKKPSVDAVSAWTVKDIERSKSLKREKIRKICSKLLDSEYDGKCLVNYSRSIFASTLLIFTLMCCIHLQISFL